MSTRRKGKIARLPHEIREQLNERLDNGEPGGALVDWLNGLPETQAMLAAKFGGEPINETNLTNWTQGGFPEWQAHQETLAKTDRLIEDAGDIGGGKADVFSQRLSVWVMSRLATGALGAEGIADKDLNLLRELSREAAEFRRSERGAEWLRLEQERRENEHKQRERKLEEEFWKWAEDPGIREAICRGFKTHAEKLALLRQVMFADVDEYARKYPRRPLPGERVPEISYYI